MLRTVSKLRLLGSGSSSSTPTIRCLLKKTGPCAQCLDAIENPLTSKNRRNNPSILLETEVVQQQGNKNTTKTGNEEQIITASDEQPASIIIDVGKTFRDAVFRIGAEAWSKEIPPVKALMLTHSHIDALGGLDDVREFSMEPLPLFCDHITAKDVQRRDPHLIRKKEVRHLSVKEENEKKDAKDRRFVGALDLNPIDLTIEKGVVKNVNVIGLPVDFCPLFHGSSCTAAGFIFPTSDGKRVAYFSDVGRLDPEIDKGVIDACRNVDLLFLDCIGSSDMYAKGWVHFTLKASAEAAKLIQPKQLKLVGIGHMDGHDELNEKLKEALKGESFVDEAECGYDGLTMKF